MERIEIATINIFAGYVIKALSRSILLLRLAEVGKPATDTNVNVRPVVNKLNIELSKVIDNEDYLETNSNLDSLLLGLTTIDSLLSTLGTYDLIIDIRPIWNGTYPIEDCEELHEKVKIVLDRLLAEA